jgi:hypothetical protein
MPPSDPSPHNGRGALHRGLDLIALATTVLAGSRLARGGRGGDYRPAPQAREAVREARDAALRAKYMGTGRGLPGTPPSARSLRLKYEAVDMSARDMTLVLLGLAIFVAVFGGGAIGMAAIFHTWNARQPAYTPQQTARIVPPGPHLQVHPHAELREERAREVQLLHAYAWLDDKHTTARIPIARAMALTVGKSLDAGP